MMGRNLMRLSPAVPVLLILVACSSEPSPTASPPTPTLGPGAIDFGPVVWSTGVDQDTGAPVDTLSTLPNSAARVHASVQAELLPAGVPIQARWTIDGASLPELDPDPIVVEEQRVDAWITWSLTWTADQPWPIGTLGIEIEVDGETRAAAEIPIVRDQDDM